MAARRDFAIDFGGFHDFSILSRGAGSYGVGGRRESRKNLRRTKQNGPRGGSLGPAGRRDFAIDVGGFHDFFNFCVATREVTESAGVAKVAKTFGEQSKTGHAPDPLGRRRGVTLL